RRFRLADLVVLLVCTAATLAAGGKRGLTADDYAAIEMPADPHISPDGKTVAYTVSTFDLKQNRRRSAIWLVPLDGSHEPRPFTTGESSTSPQWSPDGRMLAFMSTRRDA